MYYYVEMTRLYLKEYDVLINNILAYTQLILKIKLKFFNDLIVMYTKSEKKKR